MKLNGPLSFHARFDAAIKGLEGLCQKKLKGSKVSPTSRKSCKCILSLCKKYNNSIYSLQGHNKRVVARAYRSYKKNQTSGSLDDSKVNFLRQRVNKGTINNTDFGQKALNLDFVKTLKGKDLKAFTALLKNDADIRTEFVTKNKEELLSPENKGIFNALPVEAKKAFIEQNKGDIEFLSTFSNVYKEELAYDSFSGESMPELLTAFKDAIISNRDQIIKNPTVLASADKATLKSIINHIMKGDQELGKALIKSFFTVNGKFIEKALTEENKETGENQNATNVNNEITLLSFFNNTLETDAIDAFDKDIQPNTVLHFNLGTKSIEISYESDKKAFFSNLVQIIKNNNLSSGDIEVLVNNLIIYPQKDKSKMNAQEKKQVKIISTYLLDLVGQRQGLSISNVQILADAKRGWQFCFTSPNGKTIKIDDENNKQNDKFLSRSALLSEIKRQVDEQKFDQEDIKALCDFMAHCPVQGLVSAKVGNNVPIHIEGDDRPLLKVCYSKESKITIELQISGKGSGFGGTNILPVETEKYYVEPQTKASIKYEYNSLLGECQSKAASISVISFEQTLYDVKSEFEIKKDEVFSCIKGKQAIPYGSIDTVVTMIKNKDLDLDVNKLSIDHLKKFLANDLFRLYDNITTPKDKETFLKGIEKHEDLVQTINNIKENPNQIQSLNSLSLVLYIKGKIEQENIANKDVILCQLDLLERKLTPASQIIEKLRKVKNYQINEDELQKLMENSNILKESNNIEFLDKNPAALRKIPKETLQSHIQKALEGKNEPLAKALTKALDYLDQATFEKKLLAANKRADDKKSTTNSEPLFNFFQNDDSTITLTDINFEVLKDAIRQSDVKFITKDGKEITIGGYKFNGQPRKALNYIKQQIKENNLTEDEIKALADFIANGYVQTYLNFENMPVGFYRWDGDGKVHVTAQMSDEGLDVHVKTQGKLDSKDKNQVTILATANGNMAALEKIVNTDVIFHYKGSIGGAQGVVDNIEVKNFEQQIGDVTFLT